ncbi:tyrosine-protein phosphatase [Rhodobacter sp. NTK016B]|uniref:tyrosine-protein phosphatase n=1 Tax=Rhodobacter sp. NTK016B TaxID=2759676 RepID=UPI001A90BE38|nr:tyrosine-protein phosphatase [Rhodobacter sp. NTK016B]MBN8290993.1 tyrosine-protein phosphatase [Rhodobacter sp. NTK016B]
MTQNETTCRAEGLINLRDLGGIPVEGGHLRSGRLFRSAHPGALTVSGAESLRALGIRTICDLRSHAERAERPFAHPWYGVLLHLPIEPRVKARLDALSGETPDPADSPDALMRQAYRVFIAEHAQVLGAFVTRLADSGEGRGVLVHCTAGKDRTGLAVAVVLALLGADRAAIETDYLETNRHWRGTGRLDNSPAEVRAALTEARLPYLAAAMDEIATRHGSVAAFARDGMGLDDETLDRLRTALVA